MGKQRVKIKRRNWDVDFYTDLALGNGFQITEPADVSLDGVKRKSLYGPRSPLYGTTYSDEQAFIERYSCECGEFKGREFENEICPFCQTPVQAVGSDIKVTGWISLGKHKIINPYYYQLLKAALGKFVFPEIVIPKRKVDTDGHISKANPEDYDSEKLPMSPYAGVGIEGFLDDFDNIMKYFKETKKNKIPQIEQLQREKRSVFTSHIPVYSTMLRPQSLTSDSFYYGGIDKQVNPIYNLSQNLENATEVDRPIILSRIQTRVLKMWDYNFELINSKDGWIRDQILGGALNFTSRNVICPDPTLHDNEVDLSYYTFRELFKFRIIYYLKIMDDISLEKAHSIWEASYQFDNKIYQIMLYMIKNDEVRLLINRNPTLDNVLNDLGSLNLSNCWKLLLGLRYYL